MRSPSIDDSSRISAMPASFFSFTSDATCAGARMQGIRNVASARVARTVATVLLLRAVLPGFAHKYITTHGLATSPVIEAGSTVQRRTPSQGQRGQNVRSGLRLLSNTNAKTRDHYHFTTRNWDQPSRILRKRLDYVLNATAVSALPRPFRAARSLRRCRAARSPRSPGGPARATSAASPCAPWRARPPSRDPSSTSNEVQHAEF
eukprot:277717-Pleurochrysis_carterae.AAC.1